MHEPQLMHGYDWSGQDLAGWWLSEKLDGFRCYWDGARFISRQGVEFNAPEWFRDGMPKQPLDGELWAGRGKTNSDVQSAVLRGNWSQLVFRPFDVPEFLPNIEEAQSIIASLKLPAHVRPVKYVRVKSTDEAFAIMKAIVAMGGEGVMMRKPGSGYSHYRSQKLLKLKPWMLN